MAQVPDEIATVLAEFDGREGLFTVRDVEKSIRLALDRETVPSDRRVGWWAEWAAFAFHSQQPGAPRGPWKGYFQPLFCLPGTEGAPPTVSPDLKDASAETVDHWITRASAVSHPVLAARYADVAWDLGSTIARRRPHIDVARLAIDAYLRSVARDGGETWGDSTDHLARALSLARSIKDDGRVAEVARVLLDYVDRTAVDDKIGTYLYAFDELIQPEKGTPVSGDQERRIIDRMERCLVKLAAEPTVSPYSARDVGQRLASYHSKAGRAAEAQRVLRTIAGCFEAHSQRGSAIAGMHHLDVARSFFVAAGLREDATRAQRAVRELAIRAEAEIAPRTFEFRISEDDRERFLAMFRGADLDSAIERLVMRMVLSQERLKEEVEELDRRFPLQAMFKPTLVGAEGLRAHVDDQRGDPDGPMVFETSRRLALLGIWLSWGLEELVRQGLTTERVLAFLRHSPVFESGRLPLITRGVDAHLAGDWVASIHLLIPQIERALVNLIHFSGGAGTKAHRSGRAVMQAKSLNDALDDEEVASLLGHDLRMHFVAVLSHPKGMNVRNLVSHGLWSAESFTQRASEWVLHALLALGLMREDREVAADAEVAATGPPTADSPAVAEQSESSG